jgi:FkbM family methyltransferase
MLPAFTEVVLEYGMGGLEGTPIGTILDIGANCGVFSMLASQIWDKAEITAYEPQADMFRLLWDNLRGLNVRLHNKAVYPIPDGASNPVMELKHGLHNQGEASLYQTSQVSTSFEPVRIEDPKNLGPCDLLKIDTEGSEVPILEGYQHLDSVKVLVVEFHLEGDEQKIREIAALHGLEFVASCRSVLRFKRYM